MTREEYFAAIAEIHRKWADRVVEQRGGGPVESPWRDAAEHEAEVLATAEDEGDYWTEVMALTKRFREEHPLPPV